MYLKSLSHQPSLTSHEAAVIIAQEKGKYLRDKGTTEDVRISVFASISYHMHSIRQEKLVAYLSIVFRNHIKNYLHLTYDVLPGGQAIAEVDVKI